MASSFWKRGREGDASKERYLAFLGQILNISKLQAAKGLKPLVMIFTPTSWLIPRPTYIPFRKEWDKHFAYYSGFLVTSNEFFKLDGKWPLAFTIWNYREDADKESTNSVQVLDLTPLHHKDIAINWLQDDAHIDQDLKNIIAAARTVTLDNSKGQIKDWVGQKMYDFKRDSTKAEKESNNIFGGLPLKDDRRKNKKTYGVANSEYIGFMDDGTPVRIKEDNNRFKDKVWFRIDTGFIDVNKAKCFNGATDQKGYNGYDLESSKKTFTWFCIAKILGGNYPLWANQYDLWPPQIKKSKERYWYSLCFAFVLAENRCIVTKFEKDNPIQGALEIYADNPLSPNNRDSFWNTVLLPYIQSSGDTGSATHLINKVTALYKLCNKEYCKGQILEHVGLDKEPYFKYFNYPDFLTKDSGLIQIKKYAEIHACADLQTLLNEIAFHTKEVRKELHQLLVDEFKYFG